MTGRSSPLFTGALLAAGAFGVHQLRYLVAHCGDAGAALHATGHGYLSFAEPLLALLVALGVGQLLLRALGGAAARRPLRRSTLALAFAAALLVLYTGQELLEGQLAAGHASGLAGVLGGGGWVALALALAVGGVLSLAVHVAGRAAAALRIVVATSPRPPRPTVLVLAPAAPRPRRAPLARHLAGRAPPLAA